MSLFQLRTYTLCTPSIATAFAQRWKFTTASLAKLNATTGGVYLTESDPKQVIAVVEFQEGDDPSETISSYVKSEAFKEDLGEIAKGDFEGVEAVVMRQVEFE